MNANFPNQCYAILPGHGRLIRIRNGKTGYELVHPSSISESLDVPPPKSFIDGVEALRLMNELNVELGVDWRTREAMQAGSMFGWDCPAATSSIYDGLPEPKFDDTMMGNSV